MDTEPTFTVCGPGLRKRLIWDTLGPDGALTGTNSGPIVCRGESRGLGRQRKESFNAVGGFRRTHRRALRDAGVRSVRSLAQQRDEPRAADALEARTQGSGEERSWW